MQLKRLRHNQQLSWRETPIVALGCQDSTALLLVVLLVLVVTISEGCYLWKLRACAVMKSKGCGSILKNNDESSSDDADDKVTTMKEKCFVDIRQTLSLKI